ncbi:MAG: 2-dehydropantoate 2-reductase [Desulfatiglandaceae bacterium]|jgi:2-dehydropantoate 2-reductase
MKIAVVGSGAMGSLFGALLAEAENEVWLNDVWAEHVHAINRNGLEIEREGKTRRVRIKAATDAREIGEAQLVIVFVKSTRTEAAAQVAGTLAGASGMVLTLQNGMGNADIIAGVVEPARVLAGTTSHGATLLGPGSIRHAGVGPTTIGVWNRAKEGFERAVRFADLFNRAGIACEAVEDVRGVVWNKLLINVGINAITALTSIKNGEILDLEVTRNLSRTAVEEAMDVAQAREISVRVDMVEHVLAVAEATAVNRSSMGQDVDNGRQTEIGAINGFIVREGCDLGLKTPVNQALTALIETLEKHY